MFGKYGSIRQIRMGDKETKGVRGTAFVVFDDVLDATRAQERLGGFRVGTRYIEVLFYQANRQRKARDLEELRQQTEAAARRAAAAVKAAESAAEDEA